jgi:hypothetical protein
MSDEFFDLVGTEASSKECSRQHCAVKAAVLRGDRFLLYMPKGWNFRCDTCERWVDKNGVEGGHP